MSIQRLDGVYGLRQPGFAPHPVLKHRQQQRNELRRSASLVLAQNRSPALSIPVVRNAQRPLDYVDWSAHMVPSVSLQPLKAEHRPAWMEPGFVNQVPLRLEDCQARLAAVERELDRYKQMAAGGSGFKAAQLQHALFDSPTPADPVHVVEVVHSASAPQLHSEKLLSVPPPAQSMQKSGSFTTGEPAPEPSMSGSLSYLDIEAGKGLNIDLDTEIEGLEELDDDSELPGQLTVIQSQLLAMDGKWQAVAKNQAIAALERGEVESSLKNSHAYEQELASEVVDLTARKQESEAKHQALHDALGVSEGKAKDLRSQINGLSVMEQALNAQAAALRDRISSLEGEASELQGQLAEDDEVDCGRGAIGELACQQSTSLESIEEEVRKKVVAELELERLKSQEHQARLERELEAAVERHRQSEAELERLAAAKAAAAAEEPADEGTPAPEESPEESQTAARAAEAPPAALPAEAPPAEQPAEAPEEKAAEDGAAGQVCPGGLAEISLPSTQPIPELVFIADLAQGDDGAGGQGEAPAHHQTAPLPAKCLIDLASNELRLQPLAPVGPFRQVPLAGIVAATRPGAAAEGLLEIQLDAAVAKAFDKPLRLATGDAHAASALLAALELPNRVLPGFLGAAA